MEGQGQSAAGKARVLVDARHQPRFKLVVDITLTSRSCGILKGQTVDISQSGVSVMLRLEAPVGDLVELQFVLPLGSVKVYAIVRQRNAFRYGLQFVGNSPNEIILATCRILEVEASLRQSTIPIKG